MTSFKISTIDDEEKESEDEELDLISKKFIKYIKSRRSKRKYFIQRNSS